jgi:DNA polymerase-3 subunit chi
MSKVDFYILKSSGNSYRNRFACRLTEKAFRLNYSILIKTPNQKVSNEIDTLLWTFRHESFLPHEIADDNTSKTESPITVSHSKNNPIAADLLINLSEAIPKEHKKFSRIAEIVISDDEDIKKSRQRYIEYRETGHTIKHHKI